jgi:hypothetical protein
MGLSIRLGCLIVLFLVAFQKASAQAPPSLSEIVSAWDAFIESGKLSNCYVELTREWEQLAPLPNDPAAAAGIERPKRTLEKAKALIDDTQFLAHATTQDDDAKPHVSVVAANSVYAFNVGAEEGAPFVLGGLDRRGGSMEEQVQKNHVGWADGAIEKLLVIEPEVAIRSYMTQCPECFEISSKDGKLKLSFDPTKLAKGATLPESEELQLKKAVLVLASETPWIPERLQYSIVSRPRDQETFFEAVVEIELVKTDDEMVFKNSVTHASEAGPAFIRETTVVRRMSRHPDDLEKLLYLSAYGLPEPNFPTLWRTWTSVGFLVLGFFVIAIVAWRIRHRFVSR